MGLIPSRVDIEDDEGLAGCFLFFARRACARGRFEQCAHLLGAEARIRATIGEPLMAKFREPRDRCLHEARSALGEPRLKSVNDPLTLGPLRQSASPPPLIYTLQALLPQAPGDVA